MSSLSVCLRVSIATKFLATNFNHTKSIAPKPLQNRIPRTLWKVFPEVFSALGKTSKHLGCFPGSPTLKSDIYSYMSDRSTSVRSEKLEKITVYDLFRLLKSLLYKPLPLSKTPFCERPKFSKKVLVRGD